MRNKKLKKDEIKSLMIDFNNLEKGSKFVYIVDKLDINYSIFMKIFNDKTSEDYLKNEMINNIIKSNIIVMWTCFEVLFRDIFILLVNQNQFDINNLKKIKQCKTFEFDLDEIEYFCKENLNIGAVIATKLDFKKWESIEDIFKSILNKSLEKELRGHKIESNIKFPDSIDKIPNNFVEILNEINILRNEYVHNIKSDIIGIMEFHDLYKFFLDFIVITTIYFVDNFKLNSH